MATPVIPPTPPPVDAVRQWLGITPAAVGDDVMREIIDAELTVQMRICIFPPDGSYPTPLVRALYRRVGREISARNVPSGTSGEGEYGPVRLPSYDGEISRLEASYVRPVVA